MPEKTETTLFDQIKSDKEEFDSWPDWCKKLAYFSGIRPEFFKEEN